MKNNRGIYTILIGVVVLLILVTLNFSIKNKIVLNEVSEKTEIEIWTIEGGLVKSLERILSRYEEDYPEVDFKVEVYENDIYKSIIKDTLVTNEAADIFFTWGYEFLKPFIDAGLVADITDSFKEYRYNRELNINKLKGYYYNEKLYGIPVHGAAANIYVNKDMFEKYSRKYPTNYTELLEEVKFFNSQGITPISIGGNEEWMLSFLYMSLAINEVGLDEVEKMIEEKIYFEHEGFKVAAEKMVELINGNAFEKDFINMSVNQSINKFMQAQSPMLIAGSFNMNAINDLGNDEFDIEVIHFPKNENKDLGDVGVAGYIDGFVINKSSDNELIREIYMKLIKDLSYNLISEEASGLPVWYKSENDIKDDSIIKECVEALPSEGYHPPYDIVLSEDFTDVHMQALKKLVRGSIGVDEFIDMHRAIRN